MTIVNPNYVQTTPTPTPTPTPTSVEGIEMHDDDARTTKTSTTEPWIDQTVRTMMTTMTQLTNVMETL